MRVTRVLRSLMPWHLRGLVSVLVMVFAIACGVSASSGDPETSDSLSQQPQGATQQQPSTREIAVKGRLVFPGRTELTFDTSGEVGEILVQEGDRVTQGQVLARLNALSISALETELAQVEFDRDAAQTALERARKAEFNESPVERAEFEDEVARARKVLEDAEERLRDFQRNHQSNLAQAMHAKADAEEGLDEVLRNLGDFDRDRVQDLSNARQLVADKELALDRARIALANFTTNFDEALGNAMLKRASAEDVLEVAEDNLTAFKRSPERDIEEGKRIDLEILRRLEAAVEEAQTNLQQATEDLSDLQNNRSLQEAERRAAVPLAEAQLVKARDDLTKLEREVDRTLNLQMREANLEVAQARLDQAEADLEEEMADPDQAELAVREKEVALARERLDDLIDPDPFDVALRESEVAAAQARVDDAREELEGATIRAPVDGTISLVNVEVEDDVNDESRALEIIDPGQVEVAGLVDAIDIQFVEEGATARVTIASLPGEEFEGTVTSVAEEPRTERGVVSYPVQIAIDLPAGLEIPVRLSAVTTVILYQGEDG
jgi:multidrug efflux pump subunit AcrA (membrane-fusion protein)